MKITNISLRDELLNLNDDLCARIEVSCNDSFTYGFHVLLFELFIDAWLAAF